LEVRVTHAARAARTDACLPISQVSANDDDIMDMSLESLLELEVISVSKKAQRLFARWLHGYPAPAAGAPEGEGGQ
jgi:hypothetical protein